MSSYDVVLRGGMIYDGRGGAPYVGDVAFEGDRIAAVGEVSGSGKVEINAEGMAVAPGFINMLSWAMESLLHDGRSQSDIRQGVTLEVMGENTSFGPLSPAMKAKGAVNGILNNPNIKYDIVWSTLGEYLDHLEERGVACNVTSYVGLGTLRRYAVGEDDRDPTAAELQLMKDLVAEAMQEGAVGMSAALIYPPSAYVKTAELIELSKVVGEHDGVYVSHLRSEGAFFLEALEEFMTIVKESGARGQVYHLKASGYRNWEKLEPAIARIERAQGEGLPVSADMYMYNASGTSLNAVLPPAAHDGGREALLRRLADPAERARIKEGMHVWSDEYANLWLESRSPSDMLLAGFAKPEMKHLAGKTLQEVIEMRGTSPEDTVMDLLLEAGGHIFTIYFTMDEANIERKIQLPWVSFCSDAESLATEGVFLEKNPHPRAYGSFARLLGRYVREQKLIPLEEAVRRLTSFPAGVLKIKDRGVLEAGMFADVVVFDPDIIADQATFKAPHQYAVGMRDVFVNGVQVLADGEHTGALPGRFVKGPGVGG